MVVKLTIKSRMAYIGVKSKDVAPKVGLTQANFSALVNGKNKYISIALLGRLCAALDCTPNDLFEVQS